MNIEDLSDDLVDEFDSVQTVLDLCTDAVHKQIIIELLEVRFCASMGDRLQAGVVADGIHKHVLQWLDRMERDGMMQAPGAGGNGHGE
jgi:hypothetical protein